MISHRMPESAGEDAGHTNEGLDVEHTSSVQVANGQISLRRVSSGTLASFNELKAAEAKQQAASELPLNREELEQTDEFITLTQTASVAHEGTSLFLRFGILGE